MYVHAAQAWTFIPSNKRMISYMIGLYVEPVYITNPISELYGVVVLMALFHFILLSCQLLVEVVNHNLEFFSLNCQFELWASALH